MAHSDAANPYAADPARRGVRRALVDGVGVSAHAVRDAWGYSPWWLGSAAVLYLIQAALPGLQVLVVAWFVEALARGGSQEHLVAPLVLATAVLGLSGPVGRIAARLGERLQTELRYGYRTRLAERAADLSPRQLSDPQVNTWLQGSSGAIYQMGYLPDSVLAVASALLSAMGLGWAIWALSPLAGLLILLTLVPTLAGFSRIAGISATAWPQVARLERRSDYAFEQLLQQRTATELATLGTGHRVAATVGEHERGIAKTLNRLTHHATVAEGLTGLATALILGACLLTLAMQEVRPAAMAGAVTGIAAGLSAMRSVGTGFGQIVADAPRARQYYQIVSGIPPAQRQSVVRKPSTVRGDHLHVTHTGRTDPALYGVSVTARPGEVVALVGANGAGKTTCVNTLVGLLVPDQGQASVDGIPTSDIPSGERLGRFGLLTQEFGRYEFTVRETLLLGTPDNPDDPTIWAALRAARADDLVHALPHGLDTQLGQQWGGVGISGGQWQRLALARIHLRGAGIWILDEPTSVIDAEAERAIFADLLHTRSQRSTIVVTHRAWTLRGMDRIYVVHDGRIVQEGSYDELVRAKGGHFDQLFTDQLG